ncbi:glycosyltransferase family 2 protein [Thermosipho ferrireducens]|uniref:Glycosyltransferase family 2 protein n=1 Tax=Thermosipho ferrireducens TaxID=2571116 RepID=A0ABX7S7S5_9BACT|nr:glycosyltransferase family 2 protein [Thermosipho ferrireducens]QTA38638.1 glycosyltransferase family 2 protein [Thermosipho ferrireducens]
MRNCLLSVAMIVKDEEHNIRRALESIKDIVDEIIVVDTGSTDKTPEIVKEYTDKLYFYEWTGNFSDARNYSLKFPTCEWVLIYDADEEVKADFKGIREFLKNLPENVNTVYLPTLSYLDWDLKKTEVASTPRVFRNGTVKYENIVHNQAKHKGKVVQAPFIIYHYGYIWTRELREKKYNRTRELIIKFLESKDIDAIERIYYLVQLYKTETLSKYKHRKIEVGWKTLNAIEQLREIPGIGLEFLYLFGFDCLNAGLYNLAERLFKMALKATPDFPDPYYGLIGVAEKRNDIDAQIEYGETFLKKVKFAEEHPEKFEWTITGFKFKAGVHTVLAKGYLNKNRLEKFKYHLEKIFEYIEETGEDIKKLTRILLTEITKVDQDEILKRIKPDFEKILNYMYEHNVHLNIWNVVYKYLENGISLSPELLSKFAKSDFEKLVVKKLERQEEDYLIEYAFGNSPEEVIKNYGIPALLFYFEYYQGEPVDLLKFLSSVRKFESSELKGVANALIADTYLKLGNFNGAINYYKKAIEESSELAEFVKPVIDDLKTKLDSEIEGTFDELKKYFGKRKEFLFDITKIYPKEELKYLHFISNTDFAKYISATSSDNEKIAEKLLKKIENKEDFPFFYYRLSKIYEKKPNEYRKAFELHIKACEENSILGDISLGKYEYNAFYPNVTYSFMKRDDRIVWVGNISEKISGLGVINPIRMWKKCEKFYYSYPYPSDEALNIYKERAKKTYKTTPYDVEIENILELILEMDVTDINLVGEIENDWIFEDIGVDLKKDSKNILVFKEVHYEHELSRLIKNAKKGAILFFVPVMDNREDIVWYNPEFRILRTTNQMVKEIKRFGYEIKKLKIFNKNLRGIIFER